ncbi:MAG: hypothetical protein JWP03_1918, partial [Phycisphaerales bacterium]|nr:hypothetical protein [Phycisphaerales bacterium]
VKNAFPTVTSDRFYLQMLALGFQSDIARLLTKLLLPDGYLPQGGPASNAAIDLFFYRTDCQIEQELAVLGARYTRFTDGLDGSFRRADRASQVAEIFERNLERIGLRVNLKKLAECGWQPVGAERVMCGVRTNSPKGTQLPREVIKRLVDDCDSLLRGARTVAPHTLTGLARKRRALQGSLNQGSQARIAPVRDLQRRLYQVDGLILVALRRVHIHCNRQWFTKGKDFDEAASLSEAWRFRKGTHISFAAA